LIVELCLHWLLNFVLYPIWYAVSISWTDVLYCSVVLGTNLMVQVAHQVKRKKRCESKQMRSLLHIFDLFFCSKF